MTTDENNDFRQGPLDDLLILDLSRVLAGPFATMILADMGARVIKVEIPGRGDDAREFGPFINDHSAYFFSLNRNKESITLNLKQEQGKHIFRKLVKEADVLVENFRPGTLEKLGFSYEKLKQMNPGLIYAALSGFGQTGPHKHRPAYDIIVQALGGLMSITGHPDSPPTRVGASLGDITAALYTVIGILSALQARQKTGEGQLVDVAMLDCQVSILENALARWQASGEPPARFGNQHPSVTPFDSFQASDGWLVIAAGNDKLWERLCRQLDLSNLISDPRFETNRKRTENRDELTRILTEALADEPVEHWVQILQKADVPAAPIQTVDEVAEHPQVKARNMVTSLQDNGQHEISVPDLPIKLSSTPGRGAQKPAPDLGQDTTSILREFLSWDEDRMEKLKEDGVI